MNHWKNLSKFGKLVLEISLKNMRLKNHVEIYKGRDE